MKKLMNALMLSCRKATELIEKKSVTKLSKKENMQLAMHTGMCKYCKRYEKQSTELENYIKTQILSENNQETHNTTTDLTALKNKITSSLNS